MTSPASKQPRPDDISPHEKALVAAARARVGTVLRGKWRLESLLGVGGMGAVFAATHSRNGTEVAVKILHPQMATNPTVVDRFQREGLIANTIRHPGTVKVLDDDVTEDGLHFMVMERLTGETLESLWRRSDGQMPLQAILGMTDAVLDVLSAAHAHGIYHRDIKPANVFLTSKGALKLIDFGLARVGELSRLTRQGAQLGTPGFMAPEQALGRLKEIDGRSDLWSVGAMLFFLISGRNVHQASTGLELNVLVATQPVGPIAEVMPQIAPPLAALIDKALAFKKEDRWASAAEMRRALREVMQWHEAQAKARAVEKPAKVVVRPPLPRLFVSSEYSDVSTGDIEPTAVGAHPLAPPAPSALPQPNAGDDDEAATNLTSARELLESHGVYFDTEPPTTRDASVVPDDQAAPTTRDDSLLASPVLQVGAPRQIVISKSHDDGDEDDDNQATIRRDVKVMLAQRPAVTDDDESAPLPASGPGYTVKIEASPRLKEMQQRYRSELARPSHPTPIPAPRPSPGDRPSQDPLAMQTVSFPPAPPARPWLVPVAVAAGVAVLAMVIALAVFALRGG